MEHNFDNLKGVSVDNELEFQVDQTPGALLLAARKAQHLSQADVAERLHLSAHVIKDLEDDDKRDTIQVQDVLMIDTISI